MKDIVTLVKPMYPCQDVPVVVYGHRCTNGCLYCDLYLRTIQEENIISSGIEEVISSLSSYKSAYFSAVTDCFLEGNENLTHYLLEGVWKIKEDFVPLIVTKQVIPQKTIDLFVENRYRIVVQISIPSVNNKLLSVLEPGCASVADRLDTIRNLTKRGVPVIAVVMPWLDVYEENETIENLPNELAKAGVIRCIIGTSVLPERQRQKMKASGDKLILSAVERMTQKEKVSTKTGDTLPLKERIATFGRLINAFNKSGIKARICTADNPDLIGSMQLPHCTSFKHFLFGEVA